MIQLSYLYMIMGKTIALTMQTFVSKVMSLLFDMLSRFVIALLPRSKHLLISWLQSLSTVILEPRKRKSVTAFTFSSSICHEVMGSGLSWWLRWERIHLQCRRPGLDTLPGEIPWRREWKPTLVFLPGKSRGQRSLVSYSP